MNKKVLIFYATVGLGHKYIALNIAEHLKANGFEVRLEDMLALQKGKLVEDSSKVYFWLITSAPWLWKWIYTTKLINILLPLRLMVASRNSENAAKVIAEYDPDIIISTEVAASAVVANLKRKGIYKKTFGITFSDFHIHRFWVHREADFYFVNVEEQRDELIRLGFNSEKILLNGIPLWPQQLDKNVIKQKLSINTSKVILVTAGSLGFGVNKKYIQGLFADLKSKFSDFTMLVVCGKYQALLDELSPLQNEHLKIYGFYSPMDELYAISDIFVGKPGGLSTTEALHLRLPIIITHWMPGGEDLNVQYLTKNKLVMPVTNPGSNRHEEIKSQIYSELETENFRRVLNENSQLIESIANTDPSRVGEFMKKI